MGYTDVVGLLDPRDCLGNALDASYIDSYNSSRPQVSVGVSVVVSSSYQISFRQIHVCWMPGVSKTRSYRQAHCVFV